MIGTLCTDPRTHGKHALGRLPEGDSRLPVRRKKGTPAQRQLSIEHFNAVKVSVSDSGSTPSSDRYPVYCPRTTSFGSIGNMLRKTLFFSSLMGAGSKAVGGSIAMNARIWNRWVTTMSRYAPVAS